MYLFLNLCSTTYRLFCLKQGTWWRRYFKSASLDPLRINLDNACRAPGIVLRTQQGFPARGSVGPLQFHSTVAAELLCVAWKSIRVTFWRIPSSFLIRLWSEVWAPRLWGDHSLPPSLRPLQLPKRRGVGSELSFLSPLQSCFFMTIPPPPRPVVQVPPGLGQGWETQREDRATRALLELGLLCVNEGQAHRRGEQLNLASGRRFPFSFSGNQKLLQKRLSLWECKRAR